jgi:hypothetical protein
LFAHVAKSPQGATSPAADYDTAVAIPTGEAVQEYYNPELWYKSFPSLFPYGRGAPELDTSCERLDKCGFHAGVKYLLDFHDERFARHSR